MCACRYLSLGTMPKHAQAKPSPGATWETPVYSSILLLPATCFALACGALQRCDEDFQRNMVYISEANVGIDQRVSSFTWWFGHSHVRRPVIFAAASSLGLELSSWLKLVNPVSPALRSFRLLEPGMTQQLVCNEMPGPSPESPTCDCHQRYTWFSFILPWFGLLSECHFWWMLMVCIWVFALRGHAKCQFQKHKKQGPNRC